MSADVTDRKIGVSWWMGELDWDSLPHVFLFKTNVEAEVT